MCFALASSQLMHSTNLTPDLAHRFAMPVMHDVPLLQRLMWTSPSSLPYTEQRRRVVW